MLFRRPFRSGPVRGTDVEAELRRLGIRARRSMGQHFLIDERDARRQAEGASIQEGETVLEVGTGLGVLTRILGTGARRVIAIEKDRRLANALRALGGPIEVVQGDALKVEWPAFDVMVSNLPYRISSPITFRLLDLPFDRAVLMYQAEFADRLVARCGDPEYSRLSVKAYVRSQAEIVEHVPRSAFWAQPTVNSAIVILEP